MLILAVDTSGRQGSIALAECESELCNVLGVSDLSGGTFSAQLIPQTAALLAKHNRKPSDLAGFAAVSGPGSFTGLRIGLAAVKGLAEILQKPIAPISLLQVVAESGRPSDRAWAVLDAGRNEVYCVEYEFTGQHIGQAIAPGGRLLSREAFIAATGARDVVTPVGPLAEFLLEKGLRVSTIEPLRAAAIVKIGWRKIRAGMTVSPEALEADYVGHADAEIFSRG